MEIRYEKPGIPGVEYSDRALNTHTGCLNGPDVCAVHDDCWARSMAKRLAGRYGYGEKVGAFWPTVHRERMELPLKWRPSRIHLNFMGDLLSWDQEKILELEDGVKYSCWDPYNELQQLFTMCLKTPQHRYYLLTKRPDQLHRWCRMNAPVPPNVWVGTSISRVKDLPRVHRIAQASAACRWISIEPMLEDVAPHLDLTGIHWVVVGARTGRRPMQPDDEWLRELRILCAHEGVPLFFKDNIKADPADGNRHPFPAIGPATWEVE